MTAFWQQQEKVTIAGAGTTSFQLRPNTPLERLTVWVVSGPVRTVANLSFQPRINGVNFGAPVVIAGVIAAQAILTSGGATVENRMFPYVPPRAVADASLDPFVIDIFITNADANPATVTLLVVGVAHVG